jgi:pimeloyl-ACP methyl ester carboxylesterase
VRSTLTTIAAAAVLCTIAPCAAWAENDSAATTQSKGTALSAAPTKTGYAPVNGLKMYYEITGSGKPLVLLHGGLGSTGMFTAIVPQLIPGRRIVAVDLQAHGRTADIDRPITYEAMGDDAYALIEYLGLGKADVMGYSLGGGTALRLAIQHPEAVDRLVVVSTPFKRDGWYPEILKAMDQMGPQAAEQMKRSPIYESYSRIAPRPQDWTRLIDKVGDLLRRDYDWSREVAAIKAKTLIVFGDADSVPAAHVTEYYRLLGGSQGDAGWTGEKMSRNRLAILPGLTHYDIVYAPEFAATVTRFLGSN